MKNKITYLVLFLMCMFASCGGADQPYVGSVPGAGNPGGSGNVSNPPGGGLLGCVVKMQAGAKVSVQVKLNPGEDPDANANGILSFPEARLPELMFHFAGESVLLDATEFPAVTLNAFGQSAGVRQKPGSQATGPYNFAQGSIALSNLILDITAPIQATFPPSPLTTEPLTVTGTKGNLSDTGSRLDRSTKKVTFVGGFSIPRNFNSALDDAKYGGTAVILKIEGELDSIPDPTVCTGDVDGPVAFRELVPNSDHPEQTDENTIPSSNLNFGSVYVPEAGVDILNPTSPLYSKFYITKNIRVRNNQETAIQGTLTAPEGFSISPLSYNIAPGATQDFRITFGFLPVADYASVPVSRDLSGALQFGPSTLTILGKAKKAAAEIAVVTEGPTADPYNFGTIPIRTSGNSVNTRMQCFIDDTTAQSSALMKQFKIMNRGVRNLSISALPSPQDTDTDTQTDCLRGFSGQEFIRLGLTDQVAQGASCERQNVGGHEYLLDRCMVAPGDGAISFIVAYVPKNASTIIDPNSKDLGKMNLPNNDPAYAMTPLALNFAASVSKDYSNFISVQKHITGLRSDQANNTRVGNNGSLRINLQSEATQTQDFDILNFSTERLEDVSVELLGTEANRNAFRLGTIPSTIQPMTASGPVPVILPITFTKPSGAVAGSAYPVTVRITYTPSTTKTADNPSGVQSVYNLQLSGTVGLGFMPGNYKVKIQIFAAFLKANIPIGLTSLDYRNPANAPQATGDLKLNISDDPMLDPSLVLKRVRIEMPSDSRLSPEGLNLEVIRNLTPAQRKDLIRVFTSKNTECMHNGACTEGEVPDCEDPVDIRGTYQAGKCSYFYYVMGEDPRSTGGVYNSETGELILPNVLVKSINPYHKTSPIPLGYYPEELLHTTISTLAISSRTAATPLGRVVQVPDGASIAIPSSQFSNRENFQPCPENWNPTVPYDVANPGASPKPTLNCFLDRGPSGTGDGYLQGRPGVWFVENGTAKQVLVVVMIMKYSPGPVIFLNNADMWVGMQGTLERR